MTVDRILGNNREKIRKSLNWCKNRLVKRDPEMYQLFTKSQKYEKCKIKKTKSSYHFLVLLKGLRETSYIQMVNDYYPQYSKMLVRAMIYLICVSRNQNEGNIDQQLTQKTKQKVIKMFRRKHTAIGHDD